MNEAHERAPSVVVSRLCRMADRISGNQPSNGRDRDNLVNLLRDSASAIGTLLEQCEGPQPESLGPRELAKAARDEAYVVQEFEGNEGAANMLERCADEIESLYRQVLAAENALDGILDSVREKHAGHVKEVTRK